MRATAHESHRSSPEDPKFVARAWVVSWLRADSLAFPTGWSVAE
jgi:hypothetical protein